MHQLPEPHQTIQLTCPAEQRDAVESRLCIPQSEVGHLLQGVSELLSDYPTELHFAMQYAHPAMSQHITCFAQYGGVTILACACHSGLASCDSWGHRANL